MQTNGYSMTKIYKKDEIEEMVSKSPYFHATANDVDWLKKVQMQGRIQKWVDHSISVTINLPNDASEELVGKLYEEAWRAGCKGITVYRDGSRDGVLIKQDDKKDEKKNDAERKICFPIGEEPLKRPQELTCEIIRFQNAKDKWIAFVGLKDGRPYEIFTGLQDDEDGIMLPKTVTSGKIIKVVDDEGNKRYDFQFQNKRGFKTTVEGLSYKFDKEFWNYAKLISGVLRYGMPIDQVINLVSGLQLNNDSINSWKNGVERALKRFIPDGSSAGQHCPTCGQRSLIYQEGCLRCTNCDYSRCGQ